MSLPPWNAVHPLVVHFPIALLLLAPLFVVLWLIQPERWRLFGVAALVLMLAGATGAIVAAATGEESAEKIEKTLTPAVHDMLDEHEELGETTRNLFGVLTVVFAALLMLPRWMGRRMTPTSMRMVLLVYVVLYGAAGTVLVRAGHAGGRLVHEFDTHVEWPAGETPPHAVDKADSD